MTKDPKSCILKIAEELERLATVDLRLCDISRLHYLAPKLARALRAATDHESRIADYCRNLADHLKRVNHAQFAQEISGLRMFAQDCEARLERIAAALEDEP